VGFFIILGNKIIPARRLQRATRATGHSLGTAQKNLAVSKILRTFVETIRDMERMAYTNKNGKTIYENVERFGIRGTIMSITTHKVADSFVHRLNVEDSRGGHSVTIWNTAKGYDRELIKQGHSARFKGVVHRQHYLGADGTDKVFLNYCASEISKD
jgi:hypothetical protein